MECVRPARAHASPLSRLVSPPLQSALDHPAKVGRLPGDGGGHLVSAVLSLHVLLQQILTGIHARTLRALVIIPLTLFHGYIRYDGPFLRVQ